MLSTYSLHADETVTPTQAAAFIPERTSFDVPSCGNYTERLANFISDIRYIRVLNNFVGGLQEMINAFADRINLLQTQLETTQARIKIIQNTINDRINTINDITKDIQRMREAASFFYVKSFLCTAQAAATGLILLNRMITSCPANAQASTRCTVKQYNQLQALLDQSNACSICAKIPTGAQEAAAHEACDCQCTGKGMTPTQCLNSLSSTCKVTCCHAQDLSNYDLMFARFLADNTDTNTTNVPYSFLKAQIDKFTQASSIDIIKKVLAGIDRSTFDADRIAQHMATSKKIQKEVESLQTELQHMLTLIMVQPGETPSPLYLPEKIQATKAKINFVKAIIDQVMVIIQKTKDAITAIPNNDPMYKECPQNVQNQINMSADTAKAYTALDQVRTAITQKYGG